MCRKAILLLHDWATLSEHNLSIMTHWGRNKTIILLKMKHSIIEKTWSIVYSNLSVYMSSTPSPPNHLPCLVCETTPVMVGHNDDLLLLSLACLCQAKNLTLVLLKDAGKQASILGTVDQNCEVQFCVHAAGTVCIAIKNVYTAQSGSFLL